MNTNVIHEAIRVAGGSSAVAEAVGVSRQAVEKWAKRGRLPWSEYTGDTSYATTLSRLTQGAFSRDQLLQRQSVA